MASNVIIEDDKGNPVTYQNVRSVTLDGEDGGTVLFINEEDVLQPDMEQTDATALDFVKNQYFGVLPDNLTAKELAFTPSNGNDKLYEAKKLPFGVPLVIGQTYIVTWGDTECELVAKDAADIENPWNTTIGSEPYLGNSYILGLVFGSEEWGENTGEPFLIVGGECVTTDLTATTRVVGVRLANNTKKLDSQWLPDGLATESFVEEKIAAIDMPECNQAQADMAQTDPTAVDFVKNQYFGVLPDNVKKKEFNFTPSPSDDFCYSAVDFVIEAPIVIGQTYVVTWDGVEYTLVAKDAADIDTGLGVTPMSAPYLGNSSFVGYAWGSQDWGEDTGEPFLISPGSAGSRDSCCTNDKSKTTHTVGIRPANKEKKLDAKWLPDGLATKKFVEEQIAAIEIPEGGGGNGDGVGLPEVTSADNGKVLGVVKGVWAKMDAPSGGSVSTETVILEEQTLDGFVASDDDSSFVWSQTGELCSFSVGETYTVNWDGREYSATAKEYDIGAGQTAICIGNESLINVENDTGEPFIIAMLTVVTEENTTVMSIIGTSDTSATSHTVAIYQKTPLSVHWNNVTDKPFGEETATIFEGTFQDTLWDSDEDGVNDTWMGEMFIEDASDATIVDGETYAVTFDGVKYELVCSSTGGLPVLGSKILFTGVPDGVPFVLGRDLTGGKLFDAPGWLLMLMDDIADLNLSGAYTCKIEGVSVKKLDNKYLDILEGEAKPETEIFAEQTVEGFALDDPNYTENPYMAIVNHIVDFVPGETYRVSWDGVEYEMVAGNREGVGALGNLDAGDPFEMLGVYGSLFVLTTDKTTTSHKIRIYQPASDTVAIKKKYIPSNLSVSWNNITDKPFSGDKTHIVLTNDDIDVDTAVEIPELGTTFIRLTDKTLSKDELIGCSMSMRFITGELVTATISQPDISFADDNILIGTVLGGTPFVIVYKAGAVQIPIDVIAPGTPGYLTIDIPATGFYSVDELAELADKLELVSDTIKHLDNRYISFVDVEEATSTDFLPELMTPELSEIATKFTTDPASGEYLLRIPTDIDTTLKIAPAWNSKWDYARVNWNGVEYNCVPQTIGAYKLIGNMSYLSGGSGVEPFVAVIRDNNFEIYDTVNATTPILSSYLEFNTIENTSYYKATTRSSKGLAEGSAYVVQANNTKYGDRQSAKSYISGDTTYIGIGNPGLIGLSSTDEFDSGKDFFICSIEMNDGTYEWSVILTKEPMSSSVYVSPYCDVTNTFSIDLVCTEKPIIKPESIGEVSWDKISNKPFDDAKEVVIVDEEVVFKYDGSPTNTETEYYATIASVDENSIISGEEYLVNINGVECVGRHTTIDGFNIIEFEGNDGLVKGGVIFAYPGFGNVVTINVSNSVEVVTDTPVKFTIKLNKPSIKKLDEKYLPILDKVGEVNDIMPETTGTTVYMSDFSVFALVVQTTEDMFNYWHGNTTPALTGNVGIEFDGNTYECAPQRIAAFDGGLCFGDLTLLGGTGNGEPFIVTCWPEAPGVYYFFVVALADTAETEHTARIYRDDRQYKIKEEYIPALPEFDLAEMGLPALIIGGSVETECDTTAIRNALDQGSVKLKFIANVGADTPVSGVVNAMCMGGDYNCGFVGALAGIPMMLNFEVLSTKITGSIITLSAASN